MNAFTPFQIFIFGYDRYACSTAQMLQAESIDFTLLCHDEHQRREFERMGVVDMTKVVVTGNPKGLALQRNSALDLMEDGEWALFLVDDLKSVTSLSNYFRADSPLPINYENQKVYDKRFDTPISMSEFMMRALAFTNKLDANGAYLGGFAGIDNPIYRKKHYTANILCDGRAWMVKKSDLRFDEHVNSIDDYAWTALNIERFGVVLVDQWILPDAMRYTAGGYGSRADRMEQKIEEAAYLVKRFPELIAYKAKAGWPAGSHITIRQRKKPTIK